MTWRPHDPQREEQIRTCTCGWEGFCEGNACPACRMPLLPKKLRPRRQPVRSAFDYQQEFLAQRAANRRKPMPTEAATPEPSKYTAPYVTGDLNQAFWTEVLVGRLIKGASYSGTPATCTQVPSGHELRSNVALTLDSKEVIYLADQPDFGGLDLIAPAPHGPSGQRIVELVWDEQGVAEIVLAHGSIRLTRKPPRFWIKDGSGPPAPIRGIRVEKTILDEAAQWNVIGVDMAAGPDRTVESTIQDGKIVAIKQVESDTSGRPGELDAPRETVGYTRTCSTCGTAMQVQTWSSADGGHEDTKYTCPNGHTEWVDGIDS